jgi:hypothetical protein
MAKLGAKESTWPASEYGGQVQGNMLQPFHEPTPSERLRNLYLFGVEDGDALPLTIDEELVDTNMNGLLTEAEQYQKNVEAGLYDKGQFDVRTT